MESALVQRLKHDAIESSREPWFRIPVGNGRRRGARQLDDRRLPAESGDYGRCRREWRSDAVKFLNCLDNFVSDVLQRFAS